jgi:hypothetical protein
MTDERKEIIIDPSMFNMSNNGKTKKKRPAGVPRIKVKGSPKPEKKNKSSTLKKNLLRMIRGHQEKRMKENKKKEPSEPDNLNQPPKSEFEQSIAFLKALEPPKDSLNLRRNQTLKHHPPMKFAGEAGQPYDIQSAAPKAAPFQSAAPFHGPTYHLNKPNYGCLKNGKLPTYRVWKNQTQNCHAPPPIPRSIIKGGGPNQSLSPVQMNYESQLRNKIKEMSEREQHEKLKQKKKIWKKPRKQKRILRRTFRIGKSKSFPVISVLVSNKTLRNEANLKHTVLKETPISEVKQYLKKQGFIKVGTNTPNDVLREMFESASMICGELKNYSPENLLYNYFHSS